MAITAEIESWLSQQGAYQYHCFISWPHAKKDEDLTECVETIQHAIEKRLASAFINPAVFLDKQITGGANWDLQIRQALCRSVSMVAICAPIYYRPEHPWCGLEWAAMELISLTRLSGKNFKTIIPLIYRGSDNLPVAVSRIQCIDVSRVSLLGRRYYSQQEFRGKILQIADRVEQIAEELWRSRMRAECDAFPFPTESAFSDYSAPAQPFPLVS